MARKNYPDEFRRRAVDLYESTPSATLKAITADLGISCGALMEWVETLGSGATVPGAAAPGVVRLLGGLRGLRQRRWWRQWP